MLVHIRSAVLHPSPSFLSLLFDARQMGIMSKGAEKPGPRPWDSVPLDMMMRGNNKRRGNSNNNTVDYIM